MPSRRVVWVGRLTGPKGDIARRLAYEVVPRVAGIELDVVGGPGVPDHWPAPPTGVRFVGQVGDVASYYSAAELVIGAGRVALEAMAAGVPVVALGESSYVGPVAAATIERARRTNFGDCDDPAPIDWQTVERDLASWAAGELVIDTSPYAAWLADYDASRVAARVDRVYRQALAEAALRHRPEVPVLMYHRVVPAPVEGSRFKVYVTRDMLREQLTSLVRRGFESVTFSDLLAGRRVRRPVVLTFDDGYADNHEHLLPLLEELDQRAVIFALGDRSLHVNAWDVEVGEPQAALMSNAELRACAASGRVEIGSHGLRHAHLTRLGRDELAEDMRESKERLEDVVGSAVESFAYPYGEYGDREVEAAAAAGYAFGVATVSGPVHLADDFYRVRRIQLFPGDRGFAFRKKTSGWYLRYCRLRGKDF